MEPARTARCHDTDQRQTLMTFDLRSGTCAASSAPRRLARPAEHSSPLAPRIDRSLPDIARACAAGLNESSPDAGWQAEAVYREVLVAAGSALMTSSMTRAPPASPRLNTAKQSENGAGNNQDKRLVNQIEYILIEAMQVLESNLICAVSAAPLAISSCAGGKEPQQRSIPKQQRCP